MILGELEVVEEEEEVILGVFGGLGEVRGGKRGGTGDFG